MEGKKIRAIGTSLILCLAAMNISGCGLKDSESSANAVMGRVTSVSDTQIVMEVMDKQDDKKPEAASGGAAGIEGNKPQGTPPADAKDGGKKKGESKTYQIDSDTKIYKKAGEESTEISVSEIIRETWSVWRRMVRRQQVLLFLICLPWGSPDKIRRTLLPANSRVRPFV